MLWTQILYLSMVSISLLQDWNINDVPLPCAWTSSPSSLGDLPRVASSLPPGAPLTSSSGLSRQVLHPVIAHKMLYPEVLQSQFPARWRVQPQACRWSKLFHGSSAVGQLRWADGGQDALINKYTFPQLQQGILTQHTPPFSTPAQSSFHRNLLSSIWLHPSIVKYSAEDVQVLAASLISSQDLWPEPHYTSCFHGPLSQGSPLSRPVFQPRHSPSHSDLFPGCPRHLPYLLSIHAELLLRASQIRWWQVPQQLIFHLQQCFAGANKI